LYIPTHFKITDEELIYEAIETNSFATVVSNSNGAPFATHLPLILDRENHCLYGHFARANPHWKDIVNEKVLAIFQGPHCYISPSWYETEQAVPTWNYVAVHIYGKIEIVDEPSELHDQLSMMVDIYEEPNSTYDFRTLDDNYIKGMSAGVVGFKLHIESIEGKAKLSQNHPHERKQLVIEKLKQIQSENHQQIATLMEAALDDDHSEN
jgi:transcriptional regulator